MNRDSRSSPDERGATMVIIALSMVALMAFAGLAIDGGRAFATRRQAQNGADVAALAGATTLNNYLINSATTPASSIWTKVQSVAASNNVTVTSCFLVDATGAAADPGNQCSNYGATLPASAASADGVQVIVSQAQTSAFMQFVGIRTFSASGTAAASVQAATVSPSTAPWLICAVDDPGRDGGTGQTTTGGLSIPILNADNSINSAALGQNYPLKGNGVKFECGTNGSFKGLVDGFDNTPPTQYPVPGYWSSTTGNHSGPNRVVVAGSCGGAVIGCKVVLPLCYAGGAGPPPNSTNFYCVAWGAFQITAVSANADEGTFLGSNFTVIGGAGGGPPTNDQPRVVNLIR